MLLQIAKQPTEKKNDRNAAADFAGRVDARSGAEGTRARKRAGRRGRSRSSFIMSRRMRHSGSALQFKKSHVSRDELIHTLRDILAQLEGNEADSTAA